MARTAIGRHSVLFDEVAGAAGTVASWANGGGAPAWVTARLTHNLGARLPNDPANDGENALSVEWLALGHYGVGQSPGGTWIDIVDENSIDVSVYVVNAETIEGILRVKRVHSTTR